MKFDIRIGCQTQNNQSVNLKINLFQTVIDSLGLHLAVFKIRDLNNNKN